MEYISNAISNKTAFDKLHIFSQSQYADQNTQNSCLQLQNSGCQGLRTIFSNTLLSLKLVTKVLPKSTHNVFSQSQHADQNMQNSCLHLENSGCQGLRTVFSNTFLSLKLALKVVPKSTHKVFYRASMLTKIPKIYVYSFKTLVARASGLYFPTPS